MPRSTKLLSSVLPQNRQLGRSSESGVKSAIAVFMIRKLRHIELCRRNNNRSRERVAAGNHGIEIAAVEHDAIDIGTVDKEIAGNQILRHYAVLAVSQRGTYSAVRRHRNTGVQRPRAINHVQAEI